MDFSSVANVVKQFAPLLGGLIGGPAGGAVGAGVGALVDAVGSAFGLTPEQVRANPIALSAAIQADPQAAVKLAEIEKDREVEIKKLIVEQLKIAADLEKSRLGDVQNARNREVNVTKVTGKKDVNLYILAWTIVFGFFVLLGMMYFIELPKISVGPINQLMGALSTGFGVVLSYFFGSSKSSLDKNTTIQDAVRRNVQ
jgi:hypothetical protein